ncbi:hypothetical protein ACEZDG_34140 [Streptacidiphilus sp. N1-1]|uniref:Uncharacterized protein n=1 Tax=Streptacidiphilus alkalitolerans TaxID=3342712 RepID=A0ABV6VKT0_9ACTN
MPHPDPLETWEPRQRVDLTVMWRAGAFLALLVLPIMLIRGVAAPGPAAALVLAAIAAANRSHLAYRRTTIR